MRFIPVITHLLTTLDGAISHKTDRLIVVGATNHPEKIDAALLRPGRLSRVIEIELPDETALAGIYRQHLGDDLPGQDLTDIARHAIGATGAVVVDHVKAARRRARQAKRPMVMEDLAAVVAPPERRTAATVRLVAIHEAGHAVMAHATGLGTVRSISIVANGVRGGYAVIDVFDRPVDREIMEKHVLKVLGGRAAEEVILGRVSAGSGGVNGSDLAEASRLVGTMHLSMGLGDRLVFRLEANEVGNLLAVDERWAAFVEGELQQYYAQALQLVKRHRLLIEAVAADLIERRHISTEQFNEIVDRQSRSEPVEENGDG